MDVLALFRSEGGKLRERLRGLRSNIENAKRRREELLTLPLPPDDVADMLIAALIDSRAESYPKRLQEKLDFVLRKPFMTADSPGLQRFSLLAPAEGGTPQMADLEAGVFFMLQDVAKIGLRNAIRAMKYRHGPSLKSRTAELQQLEKSIGVWEGEEREIAATLASLRAELQ